MADWAPPGQPLDETAGGFLGTARTIRDYNAALNTGTAWPSANRAIFIPVRVAYRCTVYKMVIGCGSAAGGNFDVGIYDAYGNKIVTSGATARTANSEVVLDITDTVLDAGKYYFAMAADGTNNYSMITPSGISPVPLQKSRLYGMLQMATAYTLPDPVTFAAATSSPIPMIAAYLRGH